MNVTRKTWVSAGIVSVVLAGGISVAAAAATGGIGRNGEPVPAVEGDQPISEGARTSQSPPDLSAGPEGDTPAQEDPSQGATAPAEEYVVSKEVNPDPRQVTRYWTEQRLEDAQPLPMPVVEGPVDITE
ncbi:hypothetical protein [Streptosporangium minutum]|uniref:Uncharacterized protein n=1 Tax=Streptosporangium minutum TaxID=569862 RepID=A0A243RT97_9ACTN|nr:hypothetical protein [Streptosporangium minutum]OUC98236.1 hypothetical protein CA984_08020 [Streptosporangium minutum]